MKRVFATTAVILLLLLFFARLVQTAVTQSATFDEPLHLLQGILYWQKQELYSVVQNPPLINALIGIPLRLGFQPQLPSSMTGDVLQDWLTLGKQFLWQVNANGLQLLLAGRLVIVWLALLLAAVVVRWARQLFGWRSALFALILFTFDPNLLAHASLATTDMGTAVFVTIAAYSVWRYWALIDAGKVWSWWQVGLVGVAIGLALASKFSGIIFVPALILIVILRIVTGQERRGWKRPLLEVGGWLFLAVCVFLLIYRFDLSALQMDFTLQQTHQSEGHSSFLLGQVNVGGWWYYFPTIFAVKTSLLVIVLALISLVLFLRRWPWQWSQAWLWLLVFGFAGASIISRVNIGYRYLLPVLPLLYLAIAQLAEVAYLSPKWVRGGLAVAILWLMVESLWLHPHYLAYFNQLAGGPENGWQVAVDSNMDWGQDVARLAQMQQESGWPRLQASWLGTAPPEIYGLEADFLPGWPWRKLSPVRDEFYPENPAPGWYALSATQLQGVYLPDSDYYAWFREQEPSARAGYSFFVYDVPATGTPVGVGLSGIGLQMIDAAAYEAAFHSNDVQPRWFDARSSFLWPGGEAETQWAAVGSAHFPDEPALQAFYPAEPAISGETEMDDERWRYRLYDLEKRPSLSEEMIAAEETAVFADTLQYLGVQPLWQDSPSLAEPLALLTFWQVQTPPPNDLKLFIHILNEQGELVTQYDGLDVQSRGLLPGDEIVQHHIFTLPPDLPAGEYSFSLGVYDAQTLQRLTVPTVRGNEDNLNIFRLRIP